MPSRRRNGRGFGFFLGPCGQCAPFGRIYFRRSFALPCENNIDRLESPAASSRRRLVRCNELATANAGAVVGTDGSIGGHFDRFNRERERCS
jgi:hypothetical protein